MDEQTHRQRWFAFVEGRQPDSLPFFPDISDWYKARHQLPNEPQAYFTVALIPDGSGLNRRQMDMPLEWANWTYLDFYLCSISAGRANPGLG